MVNQLFNLDGRVVVITGGAGMLGKMHAVAVAEAAGCPIIADINGEQARIVAEGINKKFNVGSLGLEIDITKKEEVEKFTEIILTKKGQINVLINNAANNPQVKSGSDESWTRFENFPLDKWGQDITVSLTGAFLCSQIMGREMARRKSGVILNISSDLGVIAPDQRLYVKEGLEPDQQPVKPVTYSVVKHGIIGLTKYLATYWADYNIRVNSLSPGGVYTGQSPEFLEKINSRIPLGRMAQVDEYKGAVLFLISDASSYMTGSNLIVDGGRTCW